MGQGNSEGLVGFEAEPGSSDAFASRRRTTIMWSMSDVAEIKTAGGGLVVSNPAVRGGTPVFRGARLPVQTLFDYLADGLSLSYFLETFEGVSREQAQAVLQYGCHRITLELTHEGSA
jgi:uncharacterized protein (DUF433 family)